MNSDSLLSLFHHLHHTPKGHKVHHCGGDHVQIDSNLDYTIRHCACGKHRINKKKAVGHATGSKGELIEIRFQFKEVCPEGGWHLESGKRS